MTIDMDLAYTIPPAGGGSYPGVPIGIAQSLDGWAVNGQANNSGIREYQNSIWRQDSLISNGTYGATTELVNFYLYKLGRTSYETWYYNGSSYDAGYSPSIPTSMFSAFNGVSSCLNQNVFPNGNECAANVETLSSPSTFTAPKTTDLFTISGTSLAGPSGNGANQSTQGFAKSVSGNLCQVYGFATNAGNIAFCACNWNTAAPTVLTNSTDSLLRLTNQNNFTNFDPVSGINYLSVGNASIFIGTFAYYTFTVSDDFSTFTLGAQVQVSFSDDPATGIGSFGTVTLRPFVGGWLALGNSLGTGSSCFYLISYDFSQYWNLVFIGGPSLSDYGQDIAPIRDASNNWYTVDASGNVYVNSLSPTIPSLAYKNPDWAFGMHPCFRPIHFKLRKCR